MDTCFVCTAEQTSPPIWRIKEHPNVELKGLDDLIVPSDAHVDVKNLLGKRLADVEVAQIITASSNEPSKARATVATAQRVEEMTDGNDNFI